MINKRYNKSLSKLADRNKKLKKVKLGVALLLPIFLLVAVSFLSRLSSLQISSVNVTGEKSIAKDDIANATLESISGNRFFIFPRTNVFMVNESSVASVLSSEFPRIESVNVEKSAEGVLKVEIREREPVASWCNNSSCYLMDSTGLVYSKVDSELESFGKIVFRGAVEGDPLMKYFQNKVMIDLYLRSASLLKNNSIDAYSISVESKDKGVIQTSVGNIFINPESEDLLEAVENALLVIEDMKAKNPGTKFEYIDVRFGNKVFYK